MPGKKKVKKAKKLFGGKAAKPFGKEKKDKKGY
jgi:hypothetical protein